MWMRILFLLIFVTGNAEARLIDKTLALVNSDVVTYSDLHAFNKNLSLRRELDPFQNFFQFEPKSDTEILNYLIQEEMILQKLPVSKEEIEEEINGVQRNNKIDRDHLKDALANQGVKFESYENLMKVSLAKRKLMDRELRPLSVVTDEEVKNYYYTAPEFLARKQEQKLVLTYTLQQMNIPSKDLAEKIYKELKAGGDFDSAASEMSAQGVEKLSLGSFSEEKLSPNVLGAISGLKVGESSKPINTGSGYIILKISEIGAPKDSTFEHEREQIRNILFKKAMTIQLNLWTEREKSQSYIYIPTP
jgi:parvulin-like peptidyl-prolyl isomerase